MKKSLVDHRPFKDGPPKEYRCGERQFVPTLRDRTYNALREVIDGKKTTLKDIAQQTGLEWGWLRMFALNTSRLTPASTRSKRSTTT
jgi:hypothetical protein